MFHIFRSKRLLIVFSLIFFACSGDSGTHPGDNYDVDFKEEMRTFVKEIGEFARQQDSDFILIPQNGHRLVSTTAEDDGEPVSNYLNAVDGLGQEDLYYGYDDDNKVPPATESEYMEYFLDLGLEAGKTILVTDYCKDQSKMDDSFSKNSANDYLSFGADHRELDNIPGYPAAIRNENDTDVTSLAEAQNFLYLINPGEFSNKSSFLSALAATNYDVIIMDAFFDDEWLNSSDLTQIRTKANGGTRLLISYMSIGEAEDYRYYWGNNWKPGSPDWIVAENPNWKGNYKVAYWEAD